MNNVLRIGNFTSSEIAALMSNGKTKGSFGQPALTYIKEKNMERRLSRCLTNEVDARPTSWGNLCETRAFELLDISYRLSSKETYQHPEIPYWTGSPDGDHFFEDHSCDAVFDIKCPHTLKSFCTLVDSWQSGGMDVIRSEHRDGEKYYWQLVSNACIRNREYAELIVYAPYQSELEEIRKLADGNPKYYWIWSSLDEELPYLIEGAHYKNLNVMRFKVPEEHKELLTVRVQAAGELLTQTLLVVD